MVVKSQSLRDSGQFQLVNSKVIHQISQVIGLNPFVIQVNSNLEIEGFVLHTLTAGLNPFVIQVNSNEISEYIYWESGCKVSIPS